MTESRGPSRPYPAEPRTVEAPSGASVPSTHARIGEARGDDLTRFRWPAFTVFALLWLGALAGYVGGYLTSHGQAVATTFWLLVFGAAILPLVLIAILSELMVQARALSRTTREISRLAVRITEPEGLAGNRVASVGVAVRRELDVLSAALDATLDRVAAVESLIENQVSAVERAGGRAQMRAQMIRDLLQQERDSLSGVAEQLSGTAGAIVQSVSAQVGLVRDAHERAVQDLRSAEAGLARQFESYRAMTDEQSRIAAERTKEIEAATRSLEQVTAASAQSAAHVLSRLTEQRESLAGASDRLGEESSRLTAMLEREQALVTRVEGAAGELADKLDKTIESASENLDRALASMRERTGTAGQDLRQEAEAAARQGEQAARAISEAAAGARDAAAGLRAAVGAEMQALNDSLSGGMKALDGVAQTVGRTLAGTGDNTVALLETLDRSVGAVEAASQRLFALLDAVGDRAEAAQGALDEASRAMDQRFEQLPEVAASHAARLSALLEDQAQRMGALADAITRRAEPLAAPAEPAAILPAPAPAARAEAPSLPIASTPPASEFLDTPTMLPRPPFEDSRSNGLGAFGRLGQRLRRASAAKRAEAQETATFEEVQPPAAFNGAGGIGHSGANGSSGFWSALFARIEGEEAAGPLMPQGASVPTPALPPESPAARAQHTLEALYALAIDLDRLLEEDPPMDLWKRYRNGEADAFARRLIALKGAVTEQRMRQKYRDDAEFRENADRYCARFEAWAGAEPGRSAYETPAGQLYVQLEAALKPLR